MLISWNNQLIIILSGFGAGLIVGFIYDIYRSLRGFDNPHKIITAVQDILFWALASISGFLFLLYTSYAILNQYTLVYIMIGFIIYMKLFSKWAIKLYRIVFWIFLKLIRIILNYIKYPFQLLFSPNKKN